MCDYNAWDMFGEPPESSTVPRSAQSDSQLVKIHDSELQALGLDKEKIAEEAERQRADRMRRSKSPVLETIRKASIHVLQKFGALPKKKDNALLLYKEREVETVPLMEFCVRPREFFQEPKPFSFRDLGKSMVQSSTTKPEKCAYLFRGASYDQLEDNAASEKCGSTPAMTMFVVYGLTSSHDEDEVDAFCMDLEKFYREDHTYILQVARLPEYDPFCPVHGSRRRIARRQHLVSMQHIMSSMDHDDAPEDVGYLYNYDFLAKIIRKKKREQLSGSEKLKVGKVIQKIKANLLVISVAFLFLFSAFNGLSNLQTSVNHELGADSLAVLYMSLAVSSLFVPTYMIDRFGCKLTLITAMGIYVFYMAVNIRPSYSSLIPASVLAGVAGSCLWGAKCVYITQMGIRYAHLNIESPNTVIVRLNMQIIALLCGSTSARIVDGSVSPVGATENTWSHFNPLRAFLRLYIQLNSSSLDF
ncbi:unnamed protein product [Angiostrongylus costaricensis]|uniref:MFS domain-containing protein n=1 Tax=Angiostrongylus costaricensis TaxID=334426 RepID=A0A158PER7_ANGCS|nr:unnamed protein product [Angiostrongylus costaricensis]